MSLSGKEASRSSGGLFVCSAQRLQWPVLAGLQSRGWEAGLEASARTLWVMVLASEHSLSWIHPGDAYNVRREPSPVRYPLFSTGLPWCVCATELFLKAETGEIWDAEVRVKASVLN